jgi:hypothetical protein
VDTDRFARLPFVTYKNPAQGMTPADDCRSTQYPVASVYRMLKEGEKKKSKGELSFPFDARIIINLN